jgi:hypothetical protein
MRRRVHFVSTLLAIGALVISPGVVSANPIGPYSLPFYGYHTMTQDYGPTPFTGEPLCSATIHDCTGTGYTHWHSGIDWAMSIGTDLAATDGGTVRLSKENLYDGQGPDQNGLGNFTFVEHTSTRWSLYYHLTHNGALFDSGVSVSHGQHIAESGNTGNSTGAHLHYSLYTCQCQDHNNDIDPRYWTTSPGRIPWDADKYSIKTTGTVHLVHETTTSFWIKFTNTGGQIWQNYKDSNGVGRMDLNTTTSDWLHTQASPFAASDWPNSSLASYLDTSTTSINSVGTFTFSLNASNVAIGSYPHNYFNLHVYAETWLLPSSVGNIDIPIVVDPNCAIEAC